MNAHGKTAAFRVALINHKGGVGKTTLTVNLATALAELGKRVLIVDADPQCNITTHFLSEEDVDELLDNSETQEGSTVWSSVRPFVLSEGDVQPLRTVKLYQDGLFLAPGDIRLAEFEEELSEFWTACFRRKVRGIRGTTALSRAVGLTARKLRADYVFYDSGPNIGPLNRVIALDCSHLVIPVACDLFSLRAIKTLGHSLASWIHDWQTVRELTPESEFTLRGAPAYAGYVPQSFKIYAGQIAENSRQFLPRLERQVRTEIVARLDALGLETSSGKALRLASIKHFGHLVPAAQAQRVALWHVEGGNADAKENARIAFVKAASELDDRTGGKK